MKVRIRKTGEIREVRFIQTYEKWEDREKTEPIEYFFPSEVEFLPEEEEKKCDCCGWDDHGYEHEPHCSLKESPAPHIEPLKKIEPVLVPYEYAIHQNGLNTSGNYRNTTGMSVVTYLDLANRRVVSTEDLIKAFNE